MDAQRQRSAAPANTRPFNSPPPDVAAVGCSVLLGLDLCAWVFFMVRTSRDSSLAAAPDWAEKSIRGSFRYKFYNRWGSRFEPYEGCVHPIHPAKVHLRIRIKDSQASCLPCAAEVNPEVPVVRDRVANPVGPGATLHDDDNVAAVVEVSHRDATSSTRLMADCFDHERVSSIVRRARNTGQEGNVRDRVRDTDNEVGKVHM